MKKALLFLSLCGLSMFATGQNEKSMKDVIAASFERATAQYTILAEKMRPMEGKLPVSFTPKDGLRTAGSAWWTSGFFPGTLWYIYEYAEKPQMREYAEMMTARVEKEKYTTNNHDVGFMLYCSFGNGLRLTGNKAYNEVLLTGSNSLSTRYRPNMKAIQSWGKSKNFTCPVIIDNMMNLELLFWASKYSGDKKYADICVNHANTTMKNHYRKDYSCYHVVDYDPKTGEVARKKTWQGFSDESSWSRGQAWGLYGYTLCYRETKDKAYLKHARKIADFLISHPNTPEDMIPYWDYNAPNIPNEERDASAGALIASALLELSDYVGKKEAKEYVKVAEKIIRSLSSPAYLAEVGDNGGFILKHSTGAKSLGSEIDVPLTYADYYFLEAMLRYKNRFID